MSRQNKDHEIEQARKIAGKTEHYWNQATPAGRKGSLRRAQWVIAAASLVPGRRVLEVGCGTGFFSEILASTGAKLDAVDISPELLEKARERAPGVRFTQADIEKLPFPDASFDAVVGLRILHHLDMGAAFPEIARVLKPGGCIAFCEPNMMNPQIMVQKNVPPIKRWLGDVPGETAFFRWGLARFLREKGFRNVVVRPFDFLHPNCPVPLIPAVERLGLALERLPVMREIAGSLQISAEKP